MATLNVKNVPDELYRELQERAKREHRSVAKEILHLLDQALHGIEGREGATPAARRDAWGDEKSHSLLELAGLGKELWTGIDPARHVDEERNAWD